MCDHKSVPQSVESVSTTSNFKCYYTECLNKRNSFKNISSLNQHLQEKHQDEIRKFKVNMSAILSLHKEECNGKLIRKSNFLKNIKQIETYEDIDTVRIKSEQYVIRMFHEKGFIQYILEANEDIQWCDWVIFNPKLKLWSSIELKCNSEDPLYDSKGNFVRLGTFTDKKKLSKYFKKGLYIKSIYDIIGGIEIKLFYYGRLYLNAQKNLYEITFNENDILSVHQVIL